MPCVKSDGKKSAVIITLIIGENTKQTANQGGKIEYRVTALKIAILDSQLDLCQAATLPNHFPKKNAAIEPNPNTSKVGGTILSNMSLTEPPKKDVPKFPCTILDNQLKYCFQIGKSRPSSWLICASSCGVTLSM